MPILSGEELPFVTAPPNTTDNSSRALLFMLFSRKPKPKPVELPAFAFFKGAGSFSEWLDSLPKIEGQLLARHLLEAVKEINQAECSYEQSLEIASLIEERYSAVRDILLQSTETRESRKALVSLRQDFFARFGRLFIKVGMVAVQSDDQANASRFLPLAAQALATSLTSSYQLYRPPLAGGWLALHRGYMYLVTRCGNPELTAIYSQYYRSIVALACLQPAQLNAETMDLLVALTQRNAKEVKFTPNNSECSSHRIVAGRDQAPQIIPAEEANVDMLSDAVYVDLTGITALMNDPDCSSLLRGHLQKVLEFKLHDKSDRVRTNEAFRISVSIPAIHSELTGGLEVPDFVNQCLSNDAEKSVDGARKPGEGWGGIYDANWASVQREDGLLEIELQNGSQSSPEPLYESSPIENDDVEDVVALDKSNSGYLLSADRMLKNIESGGMIAIQKPEPVNWLLAAVRWKHNNSDECRFGVQKIAESPMPAAIKIIHSQQNGVFMPALKLSLSPWDDEEQENAPQFFLETTREEKTILLAIPHAPLRSKTPVIFVDSNGSRRAIITETLEENTHFFLCKARFTES